MTSSEPRKPSPVTTARTIDRTAVTIAPGVVAPCSNAICIRLRKTGSSKRAMPTKLSAVMNRRSWARSPTRRSISREAYWVTCGIRPVTRIVTASAMPFSATVAGRAPAVMSSSTSLVSQAVTTGAGEVASVSVTKTAVNSGLACQLSRNARMIFRMGQTVSRAAAASWIRVPEARTTPPGSTIASAG